jgi:hypothetical protein
MFGLGSLSDRQWHNIVYQWNQPATTTSVYVDGVLLSQKTTQISVRATNAPFIMGGNSSSKMYYAGAIDEVSVASEARSSQWIVAAYANGKGTLVSLNPVQRV